MIKAKAILVVTVLAAAAVGSVCVPALAQSASDGSSGQAAGSGRRHRGAQNGAPGKGAALIPMVPQPDPRQRLDVGALVCPTEADLQQHEAALEARLDGHDAPEPADCRLVQATTPVTVVDRHGQAATEVRLPGQPEQLAWTDAVVRDAVAPGK